MNLLALYLGILLFGFIFTAIAIIPWIDLLYRFQMMEAKKKLDQTRSKLLTPVGGGLLLITVITFLFWIIFPMISRLGVYIKTIFPWRDELNIVFFTLITFGLVGLLDDLGKIFNLKLKHIKRIKNSLLISLSVFVSVLIYQNLGISIINIPFIGVVNLNIFYIVFSSLVILLFVRGYNSSDNLDGLAGGSLLIALLSFWTISSNHLDTPLSVFIALWIGGLISFLYFNVYPARIWLGNCGSYSFGATLAVIGLILGKPITLMFIGAYFVFSAVTGLFKFNLQHWLLSKGWPEPKIVMRSWMIVVMTSVIGLILAGV